MCLESWGPTVDIFFNNSVFYLCTFYRTHVKLVCTTYLRYGLYVVIHSYTVLNCVKLQLLWFSLLLTNTIKC